MLKQLLIENKNSTQFTESLVFSLENNEEEFRIFSLFGVFNYDFSFWNSTNLSEIFLFRLSSNPTMNHSSYVPGDCIF